MNEEKRLEIKNLILSIWDEYEDKIELSNVVMLGYIFGEYASNEHYLLSDIISICNEIQLEKNPPVIEEVIL